MARPSGRKAASPRGTSALPGTSAYYLHHASRGGLLGGLAGLLGSLGHGTVNIFLNITNNIAVIAGNIPWAAPPSPSASRADSRAPEPARTHP
jgi:hypothetical protein